MAYTSLIITKTSANIWKLVDNTMPEGSDGKFASGFADIGTDDFVTFTTKTGQNLYRQIYYGIVTYIDNLDPENNFTPTSGLDLHTKLLGLGFFGNGSGGGETATTLLELTDAEFPNYFGRAGQAIIVAENEAGFTTVPFSNVQNSTDLGDMPSELLPNKYLTTNNDGTAYQLSNIDLIINTPIPVDVFRVVEKGVVYDEGTDTYVKNTEPFLKQPGDICEGVSSIDGRKYNLEFLGGDDESDLSNYIIRYSTKGGITI